MRDRALTIDVQSNMHTTPSKEKVISLKKALALVPLLSLTLTGATFAIPFAFKLIQQNNLYRQREEKDWEQVFSKIAGDQGAHAAENAVRLERFVNTGHAAPARELESRLLVQIDDEITFDPLFSEWLRGVTQDNQKELFHIDATIAGQLKDLYRHALNNGNNLPTDQSFANFLEDPDQFLVEADARKRANAKVWELDTVTTGLLNVWTGKLSRSHPTPSGETISHVVFLSNNKDIENDFRSVNFRDTRSMTDVEFYGKCAVDTAKLPTNITPGCNN